MHFPLNSDSVYEYIMRPADGFGEGERGSPLLPLDTAIELNAVRTLRINVSRGFILFRIVWVNYIQIYIIYMCVCILGI